MKIAAELQPFEDVQGQEGVDYLGYDGESVFHVLIWSDTFGWMDRSGEPGVLKYVGVLTPPKQ